MLNTSPNDINSNYLFFHDFVRARLALTAFNLAGGCEFTAEELLAQAADFFANDFAYIGEAQAVKYGKLCLTRAARDDRRSRRGQSLEQLQEAGWDAVEGQDQDADLDLASWSALLDGAIGRWGCPQLKEFWRATKAGMDRAEAAAATGLTQVQVTRMLDFLSEKLTGRSRGKGKPRKGDQQDQPGLFAFDPDCQGV